MVCHCWNGLLSPRLVHFSLFNQHLLGTLRKESNGFLSDEFTCRIILWHKRTMDCRGVQQHTLVAHGSFHFRCSLLRHSLVYGANTRCESDAKWKQECSFWIVADCSVTLFRYLASIQQWVLGHGWIWSHARNRRTRNSEKST